MAKKKYIAPNQLVGNYYPGKAVPRGFNYTPIKEIEFKDFDAIYDALYKEIFDGVEAIPKEIQKNIKKRLSALIPKEMSLQTSAEETYTSPDVGVDDQKVKVNLNLNPTDWAKDPEKVLKKLATSLISETFGIDIQKGTLDLAPIEKKILREKFLAPIVKGGVIGVGVGAAADPNLQTPYDRALHSLFADRTAPVTSTSAIGLTDTSLVDYTKDSKLYAAGKGAVFKPQSTVEAVQKNFINYMENIGSSDKRDALFSEFAGSLLDHVDAHLAHNSDIDLGAGFESIGQSKVTTLMGTGVAARSKIFDTHGNDALSYSIRALNNAHKEKGKIAKSVADIQTKIADANLRILTSTRYADLKSRPTLTDAEVRELSDHEIATKLISEHTRLLKKNTQRIALIDSRIDAIGEDTQKVANNVLNEINTLVPSGTTLSPQVQAIKDNVDLILGGNKNSFRDATFSKGLETGIATARKVIASNVGAGTVSIGSFLARENRASLKELAGLSVGLKEKTKQLARSKLHEESLLGKANEAKRAAFVQSEVLSFKTSVDSQLNRLAEIRSKTPASDLKKYLEIHGGTQKVLSKFNRELSSVKSIDELQELVKKYESKLQKSTAAASDQLTVELLFGKSTMAQDAQQLPEINAARHIYRMGRAQYVSKLATDVNSIIESGPIDFIVSPLKKGTLSYIDKGFEKLGFDYSLNDTLRRGLAGAGIIYEDGGISGIVKKNILEPTHYFGLNFNPKLDPEKVSNYRVARFFYENVGEKIVTKNRNKFSVLGMDLYGGDHFEGFTALGNFLSTSTFTDDEKMAIINALLKSNGDLDALESIPGIAHFFDGETAESVQGLLNSLTKFKHWMINTSEGRELARNLNIGFTIGSGAKTFLIDDLLAIKPQFKADYLIGENFDVSKLNIAVDVRLLEFTNALSKAAKDGHKIAAVFIGKLQKLSTSLAFLKSKYFAILEKVSTPLLKNIIGIRQVITKAISNAIAAIAGISTGGLSLIAEVAIALVVDKLVTWSTKFFKGFLKLDMSEFFEDVTKYFEKVAKWVLIFFFLPTLMIFMSVEHSFTNVLSSVSPVDNSRSDGVYVSNFCTPISSFPEGANAKQLEAALESLRATYMNPFVENSGMSIENFQDCYYAVLKAALDNNTDPALAVAIWIEESGASYYEKYTDVSDFGCAVNTPKMDFQAQLDCYVKLKNAYLGKCDPLTTEKYLKIFSSGGCVDYGTNPNFSDQIQNIYKAIHITNSSLALDKVLDGGTSDFSK